MYENKAQLALGCFCIGSRGAGEQVVTTNLELAQQRVSKSEAELDRTKLSLREAREEVQKAARDSVEAVSKSEHRKLLEEVMHVKRLLLRKSGPRLAHSLKPAYYTDQFILQ